MDGTVKHRIVSGGVTVERGAEVVDSVVLSGAKICAGARVVKTIVGENAVIGKKSSVGASGDETHVSPYCSGGVSLVGSDVHVGEGVKLAPNSMITSDVNGGRQQ